MICLNQKGVTFLLFPIGVRVEHYENLPMQYTEMFFHNLCKNCKFHWKNFDMFNIFVQNIDCRYMLEPPRRNKKIRYTPANSSFYI